MKNVAVVIGRDFANYNFSIKFSLYDDTGDLLIYGFPLIEDPKYFCPPFNSGKLEKIQLTQLKQFIDESIEEIEKEEKENATRNT